MYVGKTCDFLILERRLFEGGWRGVEDSSRKYNYCGITISTS